MGSKNNSWMSFSDLMTGLMVIFMFVAISYILEVQKAEQQRQKVDGTSFFIASPPST